MFDVRYQTLEDFNDHIEPVKEASNFINVLLNSRVLLIGKVVEK